MSESVWETVIGLEVHVELATRTKLFCACPNGFGANPNTSVCPVCLGLPGSLPVLNRAAVEIAIRAGEALHCRVPESSTFHRKNYFYPDMPKNFQISQYDQPVCAEGWLEVDGVRVGIERAHLEEDTGKTVHVGGGGRIHEAGHSLVDYNRAGVPLLEIVSRPDMHSSEQARSYVAELRELLAAIDASDVKMEEGSLRVDANVSLRPAGHTTLGKRVEIKNLNSLRSLGRALEYERERQRGALERGERITQETRHWDEEAGCTRTLRSKEEAFDYRYFPEPDLPPLGLEPAWLERVRASLPELPAARRTRLAQDWGIAPVDAAVLVATPGLVAYVEAAVEAGGAAPRDLVNWAVGDLLAHLKESGASPSNLALSPAGLAELVGLVADGTLSRSLAKEVLATSLADGRRPGEVVAAGGLAQLSDVDELSAALDAVLDSHPAEAGRYRAGDERERKKLQGFFMGRVMAATKGLGNPQLLARLLEQRLGD